MSNYATGKSPIVTRYMRLLCHQLPLFSVLNIYNVNKYAQFKHVIKLLF